MAKHIIATTMYPAPMKQKPLKPFKRAKNNKPLFFIIFFVFRCY